MNQEIERLDLLLMRIRRLAFQPDPGSQVVPGLSHPLPSSRIYACTLIADLAEHAVGGSLSVKDVAIGMNLEHSSASRLLTDLESDGLIQRVVDETDRRRTNIALTELGHQLVKQVSEIRYWVMGQILAEFDPEKVAVMTQTMEQILDSAQSRLPEIIKAAEDQFGLRTLPPK